MNCSIGSKVGYQDTFLFRLKTYDCVCVCVCACACVCVCVCVCICIVCNKVDCHYFKGTVLPPCIFSEHHVIPLFAEPPCIASDCELWAIVPLVQTSSIFPTVWDLTICWILMKCSARDLHKKVLPLSILWKAAQFQSYWGEGVDHTCHIDWWIWWRMMQMIAT